MDSSPPLTVSQCTQQTKQGKGMLSSLDSMLDMPIEQALARLPLSSEVAEAILCRTGAAGEILHYAIGYERWELTTDNVRDITSEAIAGIYLDSIDTLFKVNKIPTFFHSAMKGAGMV